MIIKKNQNLAIAKIAIMAILFLSFIFLISQILILYGAEKERTQRNCIGVHELGIWENTLNVAKQICVESAQRQKESCDKEIRSSLEEATKWRGYYLYLKKSSSTQE